MNQIKIKEEYEVKIKHAEGFS